MMTRDPEDRISLGEIMNDQWIQNAKINYFGNSNSSISRNLINVRDNSSSQISSWKYLEEEMKSANFKKLSMSNNTMSTTTNTKFSHPMILNTMESINISETSYCESNWSKQSIESPVKKRKTETFIPIIGEIDEKSKTKFAKFDPKKNEGKSEKDEIGEDDIQVEMFMNLLKLKSVSPKFNLNF